MDIGDAENFCNSWLPSWTGNNPEKLIQFYTDDAFYCDPTVKDGLKGHDQLLLYLIKLLRNNPGWEWTDEEIIPTDKGFVLKWKAVIPVGEKEIIEYGLDIIEICDGKIIRNEVYFDTLELINSMQNK